jgi:lysozyme
MSELTDAPPYARGCDVSHHDPVKDFGAMVASGIEFLGIKASQGAAYRDPTLAMHRDGRRARPELVGAIFYHYPDGARPEIEAANFLGAIGDLQDDEVLALDVEQGPTGIGAPMIQWQMDFIAALVAKVGQRRLSPLVYTAEHIWNEIGNPLWPDATVGKVGLWLKRYASDYGACPSPWSFPRFWQYSQSVGVPGVGPAVDGDYFVGDSAACRSYFKGA